MKKRVILLGLFFILGFFPLYALEWKSLHEKADKMGLEEAKGALNRNNASLNDLYVLGLVKLNLHLDKEAFILFEKMLSLDPTVSEAKWGKAEVLRREHNFKRSEEILQEVLKNNPDFAPAYISLAYIRYIQLRFNDSVNLAGRVLDMGEKKVDMTNHVRAHLLVGGAKGMIAHYGGPISKLINGTAVLPSIKRAQEMQPDSAGVLFGLGSFYLLAPTFVGGDIDKAEEYLKKAIEADPKFADAYVRLAQVYKAKKDNQQYEIYLNKALVIDAQSEVALDIKNGTCKFVCIDKGR